MLKVNFNVVMQSGQQDVDMDYGVDTLAGTSEVSCLLSEGILNKKIIKRRTTVNEVRAVLKQSFKSSYGQNFELIFNNEEHIKELNKMTRTVFSEVMRYFISEALYLESEQVTPKAEAVINNLSEIEDELIDRIRNPLIRMHQITSKSGYDVNLNFSRRGGDFRIASLNVVTAKNLTESRINKAPILLKAAITRYNTRTGNGRLVLPGEDKTVAFGFFDSMRDVSRVKKRKISENLHFNDGLAQDFFQYLTLNVREVKLNNDETIKYLILGIQE